MYEWKIYFEIEKKLENSSHSLPPTRYPLLPAPTVSSASPITGTGVFEPLAQIS